MIKKINSSFFFGLKCKYYEYDLKFFQNYKIIVTDNKGGLYIMIDKLLTLSEEEINALFDSIDLSELQALMDSVNKLGELYE